MYALVQYLEDDIFYISKMRSMKSTNNKDDTVKLVKYSNGYYYPAKIISTGGKKKLEKLLKDLQKKTDIVVTPLTEIEKTPEKIRNPLIPFTPRIFLENIKYPYTDHLQALKRLRNHKINELNKEETDERICFDYDTSSDEYVPESNTSSDETYSEIDTTPTKKKTQSQKLYNNLQIGSSSSIYDENITEKTNKKNKYDQFLSTTFALKPPNSHGVTILKSEQKKWDKRTCCMYCKKLIIKFPRHLQQKHNQELDVQKYLSFPKASLARKHIINKIRQRGNFYYNTKCLQENEGNLIVKRRPQKKNLKSSAYLPCSICLAFYKRDTLFMHYKTCASNVAKYTRVQSQSMALLPVNPAANELVKMRVLPNMRDNIVTETIKHDKLILMYGSSLTLKYVQEKHLINFIRQKLRQLSRLYLAIKELDPKLKEFSSLFEPKKFNLLIEGINKVAGFNANSGTYNVPSLPTVLGTAVKKCAELLVGEAIQNEDEKTKIKVENFVKMYDLKFTNLVSRVALNNLAQKKWNKQEILPVTKDIEKLNKYLKSQEALLFEKLTNEFGYSTWDNLSKCVLIRILLFNRRRVGEMERLKITDFNKRHSISTESDIYKSLTPVEKMLASRYCRLEIRGKLCRGVPVLLSHKQVEIILLLLKHREMAHVHSSNPFVFGRRDCGHLNACSVLRNVGRLCGATNPESLTGTKLRKQIATVSQLLALKPGDMEQLANYLGHDLQIHKNFYRMPSDAIQLAKISKLLIAVEEGKINEMKGKNFDTIHIDSLNHTEEYTVEEYIEDYSVDTDNEEHLDEIGPDLNIDIEDDTKNELEHTVSEKFKKLAKIKRKTWSTPEKHVARRHFTHYILQGGLPSKSECMRCINEEPSLKNRTWLQLKAWIHNQQKALTSDK